MTATTKKSSFNSNGTLRDALLRIGTQFSLGRAFDDFLTLAIAACTRNLSTGLSYYEAEYLETIAFYKDSNLRFQFPEAFALLISEMDERVDSELGNDILGEFFEQELSHGRNGQFFTPFPVCAMMASVVKGSEQEPEPSAKPLRILDPSCGSGRMLLAARKVFGTDHSYFGIDIDRTCTKMAALNLFLNGIWRSEVMCANAVVPSDFTISYRISFLPLGIFKIVEKESSLLWQMHQQSFMSNKKKMSDNIVLDQRPFEERPKETGTQLNLF